MKSKESLRTVFEGDNVTLEMPKRDKEEMRADIITDEDDNSYEDDHFYDNGDEDKDSYISRLKTASYMKWDDAMSKKRRVDTPTRILQ